ncbi:MAG: heavy metal translocating P-type ATPase, partial [Vallitaleaceae bacterium]|nr:heavy metal translocating P-type ATPase [Vallitaleaceae bacterium]
MDGNTVKKEFYLDGLGCANCAFKIEEKVKHLEGVSSCTVNFVTKTLILEVNTQNQKKIIQEASKHASRIEAGLKVIDKEQLNDENHNHNHSHNHVHSHSHDHSHSHSHNHSEHGHEGAVVFNLKNIRILSGVILFALVLFIDLSNALELTMYMVAYLLVGGDVVYYALRNIVGGQWLDENFLMSIATIGAFVIGEYPEAVSVMLFYQVGEAFQDHALHQSRKSIRQLLDIKAEYANRITADGIERVKP